MNRWTEHIEDGHFYRIVNKDGRKYLEAAPAKINDRPDVPMAYFIDLGEHLSNPGHAETFSKEIAALLNVPATEILAAVK